MRRTTSGLLSLALATGLGASLTVPIATATPTKTQGTFGDAQTAAPSDSLPDPIADKQSELRKTAVASRAQRARRSRNASATAPSSRSGQAERAATAAKGSRKAQKAKKVDQYVELAREDTDELFVLVVQFGNERDARSTRRRTPTSTSPGPTTFDGPPVQQDPRAEPGRRQPYRLVPELRSGVLPGPLLRRRLGHRTRVDEAVLRAPVLRSLLDRRHGHRAGHGAVQRGTLRPQQRLPVCHQRVQQHLGPRA